MRRTTLLAGALLLPLLIHLQPDPTRLTAAQLQADVAVLQRAYQELHPGLYRYNTPEQMAGHFRTLTNRLNRDQTLEEAYLAISQFLAMVKCGHTYANFVNQSDEVAAELLQGRNRLPFYFRWLDRRMIVTQTFSPEIGLERGSEVVAINGVPAGTILDSLMTIARADGSSDAKRVDYLSVQGTGRYEAFDVYYPMFFPPTGDRIRLQVRAPGADSRNAVDVQPLSYQERLAPMKAREEARQGGDAPLWQLTYPEEGTALLRMYSWALYNSRWIWRGFLDSAFAELARQGTGNLVIDIRGNEGGQDVGDDLIARIARQDIAMESFTRRVRYRTVPPDLRPYLDTWDPSFYNWGPSAVDSVAGFFRLTKWDQPEGNRIRASASPFRGRVFVLIDASNSSATFQFAQAIKRHKLGTLVGQATGGNQRGINGGAFFFLRLPNSKIEVDLPLVGYFPSSTMPDAGIEPDVHVRPTGADIARGRDPELEVVKGLIAAQ